MTTELTTKPESPLAAILSSTDKLKDLPIETVERLFAMHREQLEDERRAAFTRAMQQVHDRAEPIRREGHNPQTRSRYAKLEHVKDMLDPLLTQAGLSYSFSAADEQPIENQIMWRLRIRHEETGFYEDHLLPAPIDTHGPKGQQVKTALHGLGSSMTYVHRIMLIGAFGLETSDDADGNRPHSEETVTAQQVADIKSLREEVGGNAKALMSHFKIERLEDLPASRYREMVQILEARRQ